MHSLSLIRSAALSHGPTVATRRSLAAAATALLATNPSSTRFSQVASPCATRPYSFSSTPFSPPTPTPARETEAETESGTEIDLDASFTSGSPISGSDLAALIRAGRTGVGKDVLLIDVRNPDEHAATGLIPTAVPLPLPELQAALQEPNMQFQLLNGFPKPSREASNLVMYCKAGVRSDMAAQVARGLGFKRVRSYKGSWNEWSSKYANVVPEGQALSKAGSSS